MLVKAVTARNCIAQADESKNFVATSIATFIRQNRREWKTGNNLCSPNNALCIYYEPEWLFRQAFHAFSRDKNIKLWTQWWYSAADIFYYIPGMKVSILWLKLLIFTLTVPKQDSAFNPLRARFFIGNINTYLHFVSFLHIDMTQVVEILPQIREEPTYST